jgi:CheY-like chemotaxis protein
MTAEPLNDCVMVVDDEFLIVELLSMMLEELGIAMCGSAGSAQEAVALAEQLRPRAVLMDVRLKGTGDGIDAARAIRQKLDTAVIFVTGSREPATLRRIALHEPALVLFKPIRIDQLRGALRSVLDS